MSIGLNDATQSYLTSIVQGGRQRKRGRSQDPEGTLIGYTPLEPDNSDQSQASGTAAASSSASAGQGSQLPAENSEIFYQKMRYADGNIFISSYESAYAEINQSKLSSTSVALQAYNEVMGMERREQIRSMFAFSAYA